MESPVCLGIINRVGLNAGKIKLKRETGPSHPSIATRRMKKIFSVLMLAMISVGVYAQGTITFANNPSFPVITNNLGQYGNAMSTVFHVSLYWGVLGSTDAQLVQIGPAIGGSGDGLFNGGVYTTPGGTAPGGNAVIEVKGWTGNFGTFEEARAASVTNSAVLTDLSGGWTNATGLNASTAAPFIFGTSGFNCLVLIPTVPEPSTVALGGLGAAAIWWRLRRRRN